MTDTYTVVFRGDLVPGTTPGEVRQRLQEFFRLDDARVERLFSGRPVAIRKNIELDRARQLRDMLAAMGALAEVRGGDGKAAIAASSAAVGDGLAAVTVAPPGADILRPEERRPVYCRDIATGHLSVDRAGGDVLKPHERRRPMALQIDLSHLEISSLDLEAVP
ncbi:MAG: hypothetical protein WC247_16335 [Porticoccaceae bacterium]